MNPEIQIRFPNAQVTGTGAYAAVYRCSGVRVALFRTRERAQRAAIERCEEYGCVHNHSVAEFPEPSYVPAPSKNNCWEDPDDREWEKNWAEKHG